MCVYKVMSMKQLDVYDIGRRDGERKNKIYVCMYRLFL